MLSIKNLDVSYDRNSPKVIRNLSLDVKSGTILSVLGQNGVGKSTLLRCLTREIVNYGGKILIEDKPIKEYSIKEYSQKVGIVASQSMTYQNLLVADYLMTGFAGILAPFEHINKEKIEKAMEVLAMFQKEELFNKQINQLSSGERQLVMISRAIVQNPEIVLLDEPMANLDVKNQLTVLEKICMLKDKGYTILVTTHNPGHALALNGKVLLMGKEKYLAGDVKEIITEPNLSECYEISVSINKVSDYQSIVFHSVEKENLKVVL